MRYIVLTALLLASPAFAQEAQTFVPVQLAPGTRICLPEGGTIRAEGATLTLDKEECVTIAAAPMSAAPITSLVIQGSPLDYISPNSMKRPEHCARSCQH